MSIFIQVGAGAGDQDTRLKNRDGFTEYVKSLDKSSVSRIILIEANPLNVPLLIECWKDYPQAEIHTIAIVPERHTAKGVYIHYCEKDGPNYQVTSVYPEHIKKHYGEDAVLKKIFVGCMTINEFNALHLKQNDFVKLYSLDIEGLDGDIVLEIDLKKINCEYLSFEYISLGKQEKDVLKKMRDNNYIFDGRGIDVCGYDWLFRKDAGLV